MQNEKKIIAIKCPKMEFDCPKYKIKIKLRSFKSSEHINEKRDGPYPGFGYLSIFSDPVDLATWSQRKLL